jgi:hypothetical protein
VAISLGAGIFAGRLRDILIVIVVIRTQTTTTMTTKQPKGGETRKMSGIESNIVPFVSTIGFGSIAGFLAFYITILNIKPILYFGVDRDRTTKTTSKSTTGTRRKRK